MKSGEEPALKREFLGEKLRKVGKRGGHRTPVAPFSRPKESTTLLSAAAAAPHATATEQQGQDFDHFRDTPCVSVRKLAATLWELDNYNLPLDKMHNGVGAPPPRLRRIHHRHGGGLEPNDPSPCFPQPPGSSNNLRRQLAASLMQHHQSVERSSHAVEPVSPASYGSSVEITPYYPVPNPSSSAELKERTRDTNYSLKTSTELLKVLNRIWSLEEQHVSNMSLVKALKEDLDHARSRIKELTREQQADHHEMDELVSQIKQEKLLRKNKEHVRIDAAIESIRGELEDERKLRKRSESLHRKLARELHDMKTTLAGFSKELENERKSRNLLEDLCDEFAWGIKEYEKELHAKRQISEKNWDERPDRDQLILHVSESWLDERMEMKMKTGNSIGENKSALDKLRSEIEAFIHTKRNPTLRRRSLQSIQMNTAVSAPRDDENDDDSETNGSNCFELDKMNKSNIKIQDEALKEKQVKKKLEFSENATGKKSSLQVRFEEQMAQAMSHGENINHGEATEQITAGNSLEKLEAAKGSSSERHEPEGNTGLNTNYMIENLIRHHYLLSDNGKKRSDKDYGVVSSIRRNQPSPVRPWTAKLPSHDLEVSESSSKLPQDLKQNTLKTKLLEARARGQHSRSRPKASVIPYQNE